MFREMLADRASTVLWRQWERFRTSSDIHGNPRAAVSIPLDRLFLPATDDIPGTAARHSLTRTCHSGVIRNHWWWCTARLCIPVPQGTGVEDSETRVGPYMSSIRSSVIVVGANFYQRTNRHARELGLCSIRFMCWLPCPKRASTSRSRRSGSFGRKTGHTDCSPNSS